MTGSAGGEEAARRRWERVISDFGLGGREFLGSSGMIPNFFRFSLSSLKMHVFNKALNIRASHYPLSKTLL